jgi:hypothetical protein
MLTCRQPPTGRFEHGSSLLSSLALSGVLWRRSQAIRVSQLMCFFQQLRGNAKRFSTCVLVILFQTVCPGNNHQRILLDSIGSICTHPSNRAEFCSYMVCWRAYPSTYSRIGPDCTRQEQDDETSSCHPSSGYQSGWTVREPRLIMWEVRLCNTMPPYAACNRRVGLVAFSSLLLAWRRFRQSGVVSSRPPMSNAHRWASGLS